MINTKTVNLTAMEFPANDRLATIDYSVNYALKGRKRFKFKWVGPQDGVVAFTGELLSAAEPGTLRLLLKTFGLVQIGWEPRDDYHFFLRKEHGI